MTVERQVSWTVSAQIQYLCPTNKAKTCANWSTEWNWDTKVKLRFAQRMLKHPGLWNMWLHACEVEKNVVQNGTFPSWQGWNPSCLSEWISLDFVQPQNTPCPPPPQQNRPRHLFPSTQALGAGSDMFPVHQKDLPSIRDFICKSLSYCWNMPPVVVCSSCVWFRSQCTQQNSCISDLSCLAPTGIVNMWVQSKW